MRFGRPWWRYRFELFAFVAAFYALRLLPVETASWVSGKLWRKVGPRVSRRHERALANIALALPDMPAHDRHLVIAGMWENLGRVFAEMLHLDAIAASDRVTIEAPAGFETSLRGAVLCAAHQANWEVAILAIPRETRPAGIYQRLKNPFVDAKLHRLREALYPGGLMPKGGETARRLIRHVREGGTLAMLADQRAFYGLKVDFFGRVAPSTPVPARVARSFGGKLYAAEILRRPGVRFIVRLVEIAMPQTEDRDADMLAATQALQRHFEASIRRQPDQWMWSHRRWG